MRMSLKSTGWALVLLLALGMVVGKAAPTAAQDSAAAPGETAVTGDTAAAAGDVFDQQSLPTVPDEDLEGGFTLPLLPFFQEMISKGGVFIWFILAALVIGIAVVLERIITLSRARVNTRQFMAKVIGSLRQGSPEDAIEICQRTRGPIAAIIHAGLLRAGKGPEAVEKAIESAGTIEMSFLQRGLIVLASIANVAPLLGFLGTVSGMIAAFNAIAAAEQVSAKLVATGISEALITTAAGLVVAIPMQLSNNFFISRIDRFVLEMEEASVELVDTLVDLEAHHRG